MAAPASKIFDALAVSLDKAPSAVEAYGLALRHHGWWEPTKRGRAASPIDDMGAAKLLLALLSEGPKYLPGFFIQRANMVCQAPEQEALVDAVRTELGISDEAKFLDFIAGFVSLYRLGQTERLIYWSPSPDGFLDEFVYDGPNVDVRIKGPFPIGVINFIPSVSFANANNIAPGTPVLLSFLDQLYGWRDASGRLGEDTAGFDDAIHGLRRETSRGIGYERYLTGRELTAVAGVLGEVGSND